MAFLNFTNAYQVVTNAGNLALKEQNSIDFSYTALNVARIRDASGGLSFSGNDVVVELVVAGQTYYGWISRPIKVNGIVRGFYFWSDPDFTSLAAATADGNADSDSGADNFGFVLVVDQAYFTQLANGAAAGSTLRVGSSSDRVDTALNSFVRINSAPVANNDTLAGAEDTTLTGNVLTNDTDANNDLLTVTGFSINGAAGTLGSAFTINNVGTFTLNSNGSYTFVPAANYFGPVPTVTYTVSDGVASSTARLTISVNAVNDLPTSSNDSVTITEDTSRLLTLADFGTYSDVDGNPIGGVVIASLPGAGSLSYFNGTSWVAVTANQSVSASDINAGRLRYTPAANSTASTSLTFKVTDGTGASNPTYTLTIDITAVNDAPSGTDKTVSLNEDASYTLVAADFGFSDAVDSPANSLANVIITALPQAGTLTLNGAAVTLGQTVSVAAITASQLVFTPALNANGTGYASLGFRVQDDGGTANGGINTDPTPNVVTFNVTAVNDAPVANNDAGSAAFSATVGFRVNGTGSVVTNDRDPDGDTLTATRLAAGSSLGSSPIEIGGTQTVVTNYNITGNEAVVYRGGTLKGATSSIPISGTVTGDSTTAIPTGTTYTSVTGSGNTRVITFSNPVVLTSTSTLTFASGGTSSSYTLIGSGGAADELTIALNAVAISSPSPSLASASTSLAAGMVVTGTGLTGTTVQSVLSASSGTTSFQIVTLSNSYTTAAPASDYSFATSQSSQVTGGPGVVNGSFGQLSLNPNGTYTYTPTSGPGTDTFTYEVKDPSGSTATAQLVITVASVSAAPPTVNADTNSVTEKFGTANGEGTSAVTGNVLTGGTPDSGASGLRVDQVSSQTSTSASSVNSDGTTSTQIAGRFGTLTLLSTGGYTYQVDDANATVQALNAGQSLTDVFTYRATDSGNNFASTTLTVTINGANDAPVAVDDSSAATEAGGTANDVAGANGTGNVLNNDTDVDSLRSGWTVSAVRVGNTEGAGNAGTVGSQLLGSFGRLTLNSDGTYSYAVDEGLANSLAAGATATDSFNYTILDQASGRTDTAVLTVTVTGANDAPVNTVPGAQTVNSYEALTFTAGQFAVTDPDGNLATSSSVTLVAGQGTLSVTGTGGTATGTGTLADPLVVSGTQAEVNARLGTLVYTPTRTFSGSDSILMTSKDALDLTDSDSVTITVSPDARALTVTGTTANESSPFVLFSVSGATGQFISLALASGTATVGQDAAASLEYYNGTTWQSYQPGSIVQLSSTNLLVRVPVLQDGNAEGAETLTLSASNQNNVAFTGNSTIVDDGTGGIFLADRTSLTPNVIGDSGYPASLDDDRALTVNTISVNEASSHAVFTVTGAAGQVITLALANGTASATSDYTASTLQIYNGTDWVSYSQNATIPAGGILLVRTPIVSDDVYEGPENFGLKATNGSGVEVVGTASIYDDGTGTRFTGEVTNTSGVLSPTTSSTGLDNDLSVTVTAHGPVNEASTYAPFTVVATGGAALELSVQGSGTSAATVTSFTIQFSYDGTTWTDYNASSTPLVPGTLGQGTGTVFVRVAIGSENETLLDGPETFTLNAVMAAGGLTPRSASAETTLVDAANGTIYSGNFTAGAPATSGAALDDDRTLTVSGSTISENSAFAVFKITGVADQQVSLALGNTASTADRDATLGTDTANAGAGPLEILVNGAWTDYTASSFVALPAGGALLARTRVTNDDVYENAETFTLVAQNRGGASFSGTTTVVDNGTSTNVFDAGNLTENPGTGTADNDTPTLSIADVNATEGGTAVFIAQINRQSAYDISFTPSLSSGTAILGTDTAAATALQFSTDGGGSWATLTGAATIAAGQTSVRLRLAIPDDGVNELAETFTLVTGTITGGVTNASGVTATATIAANGTPTLSISNVSVNEASPYAVVTASLSAAAADAVSFTPSLVNGTATSGTDTGTLIEYWTGTAWATAANGVSMAAGATSVLLRFAITQDTVFEGSEALTLSTGTITGSVANTQAATGTVTLLDNGTGAIFLATNNTATANTAGDTGYPTLDNDTPTLSIADVSATEGGNAVFTAQINRASTTAISFTPSLTGVTATLGTDTAATTALEISTDGGTNWTTLTGAATIAAGQTSVQLRLAVADDTAAELAETFTLSTGAITGGVTNAAGVTATATIAANDTPTLSISNVSVNEASPYAVVTASLSAAAADAVSFTPSLVNGTATSGTDTGTLIEYWTGTAWATAANGVSMAAGATSVLLRFAITNDDVFERSEALTLSTGTITGSVANTQAATGTVTLLDNGTGAIFLATNNTATANTAGDTGYPTLDNDAAIQITAHGDVNEASSYALFTVVSNSGEALTLAVANTTAALDLVNDPDTSDDNSWAMVEYSTDGTTWTIYSWDGTAGNRPTVPGTSGTGTVYVRVRINSEVDTVFEGAETFTLTATAAGKSGDATATIVDGGTGNRYAGTVSSGTVVVATGELDDDRPRFAVSDVTVLENAGTATVTVTRVGTTLFGSNINYATNGGTATAGSDYTNTNGTLNFGTGETSKTFTIAINNDVLDEDEETIGVALSGVTNGVIATSSALVRITDNDTQTVSSVAAQDMSVVEGNTLVYVVRLSAVASVARNYDFALSGTASAGDYGTPTFSDGVTLVGNTISVPAGVSSFTINVPTTDDSIIENAESLVLAVGGVASTGTITDNDTQAVSSVVARDASVVEGNAMVYTVALSAAASVARSYDFALSGSASTSDYGTPTFNNGVTLVGNTITVPAGVTSFTVTVGTTDDSIIENAESLDLTVGGVAATGTITDNDTQIVSSIVPRDASVVEGNAMVYTVALSAAASVARSYEFALSGSASTSDYGTPTFSNGVTLVGNTITVPAGVTSFTVTVATTDDSIIENAESLNLAIGGVAASGTITDNDTQTVSSVVARDASVVEGNAMVYTVTLSAAASVARSYDFALSGSASTSDYGTPTFNNGVTLVGNTITVPAGVTSFTVTVGTTDDSIIENAESLNLAIGGVAATGTITDNDTQTVSSVVARDASVVEGNAMVYTVALSAAASVARSYDFALSGTASGSDYGTPTFSNGVTLVGNTITVPAGVSSFTVTVGTTDDSIIENAESLNLAIGGVAATGTITDNDTQIVSSIVPRDASVVEGNALVYTVALSAAASVARSHDFALSGTVSTSDYGTPQFSNGVTLVGNTITVPAGVTSFTFTVGTTDDSIIENAESLNLAIGGVAATGTVIDNDTQAVSSIVVRDASVVEGNAMVYTVVMSAAASVPRSYDFAWLGSASAGDYGTPTFSNGVTLVGNTITKPAGVSSFTVTVATTDDSIIENAESLILAIGGAAGTGTITDNDTQAVSSVVARDASVVEGNAMVYTVALSAAASVARSYDFALSGTASGSDYGTPTFSNGVTLVGNTITVPAGVSSFTVTVATTDDSIIENAESLILAIGGAAGTGTITDNDTQTVSSVVARDASVVEGNAMVYTVALSAAASVARSYDFALSGTASGSDYGTPTFSNGVTLVGNTITVPAGVTSFTVTVATTDDSIIENVESLVLTVGGVAATGAIADNDAALTVSSPTVNEVSPFAVFTVGGTANNLVFTLGLASGTASGGGVDYGSAAGNDLSYSTDGGATWQIYTGSITATGSSVLVRTPVINDNIADNGETFTLTATPASGVAGTGTATIADNGTGSVFANDGLVDLTAVPNDDNLVTINSFAINEASPFIVWRVQGTPGQLLTLGLEGTATGSGQDYNGNLQVRAGGDWIAYDPNNKPAIPSGGTLLVRTGLVDDAIGDDGETVTLLATPTGGQTATGTASVRDTGTGTVFNPDGEATQLTATDDRPRISVSNVTAQEREPYATTSITLSQPSASPISFTPILTGNTATIATDFGPQLEYFTGTSWEPASNGIIIAPGTTTVLVRTPLVQDILTDEGTERFTVSTGPVTGSVRNASGASGTISIIDAAIINQPVITDVTETPADPTPSDLLTADVTQVVTVVGESRATVSLFLIDREQNRTQVASSLFQATETSPGVYRLDFGTNALAAGDYVARLTKSESISNESNSFTIDSTPGLYDISGRREAVEISPGLTVIRGAVGGLDQNRLPTFWTGTEWRDSDGEIIRFDFNGPMSFNKATPPPSVKVVAIAESGATLELDTQTGSYTYKPVTKSGIDTFTLFASDGNKGERLKLSFDPADALDRDGIPGDVEQRLATMSNPNGVAGDLNNDGIADANQNAVTTLAWTTVEQYNAAINGTLNETKPIISVQVVQSSTGNAVDDTAQLFAVRVLDQSSNLVGGSKPINAPWDPIQFSIEPLQSVGLIDIDPNRAGTQIRVLIDISNSQVVAGSFTGYMKYVNATALSAGMFDLDGRPITATGWYDFTQRTPGGDGARFVTTGNFITAIELILTDNAFGDNDPELGRIYDPGVPVSGDITAPVITGPSNGPGAATSAAAIPENTRPVATLTANEAVTWAITGGVDARFFSVDPATGALTFVAAPDFEAPADLGGNNVYDLTVTATDTAGNASTQAVAVTVTNVDDTRPVITGPSNGPGAATSATAIPENTRPVATLTANEAVTWAITGGVDARFFSVDPVTGALTFVAAPDFEAPADLGGNNVYELTVTATDTAGNASTQAVAVTVTNVDDTRPVITGPSNGPGAATSATAIPENTRPVATLTANEAVTWAITGGVDARFFSVDPVTGALTFVAAPDFEAPADLGGNNVYELTVTATDTAGNASTQAVAVTVTNVLDPTPVFAAQMQSTDRLLTGSLSEALQRSSQAGTTAQLQFFGTNEAAANTVKLVAWVNLITGDYFYAPEGQPLPYDCYVPLAGANLPFVLAPGTGAFDVHLFINSAGITQIMGKESANALNLLSQGYQDLGAIFASVAPLPPLTDAMSFG